MSEQANKWAREGSKQCGASKGVSSASEQGNGRASDPVHTSGFSVFPDHSALVPDCVGFWRLCSASYLCSRILCIALKGNFELRRATEKDRKKWKKEKEGKKSRESFLFQVILPGLIHFFWRNGFGNLVVVCLEDSITRLRFDNICDKGIFLIGIQ